MKGGKPKTRTVTICSKDQSLFKGFNRGKGKQVKRFEPMKLMQAAAKRGRMNRAS